MKTPRLLGRYLVGLCLLGCGTFGCGAGAGSGTRTAGNVDEAREHEAQRALLAARKADSIEAYEAVTKKYEGTRGGEQARMELARRAAELARAAIGRGDRDEARVLAVRALELGDPVLAQQATTTLQQVDIADARETAERVEAVLQKDNSLEGCEKAVMLVADTFGPKPSKLLVRDLRKSTLQPLTNCLQSAIDAGSADASFGAVRKIVEGSETEQVLGPDMRFSVLSALNDQVVASLHEVTQSDLKAGRWTDAFTSIDAWGSDGRAGEQQLELAKQKARDLITTQLLQQGRAVLGAKPADRVLADVDLALELFEGMNVSDELRTLREQLALWVECRRLACTASTKPEPAYNFGATGIHPADDAQGQATARLPNGTRVWVLARGRGFALVARTQPGEVANWEARAAAAGGWVAADSLKREDTKTWLPSGKALVGERVWLPTGRGDGLYLLGVVQAVDGAMVKIKKEGDGQDELVSRNDLRSGILAPGTKVLAFCRDTLKPTQARMQEVTRPDSRTPLAKVTCLNDDGTDANTHEELLGALRARAAWLPVRKP